MFTDTCHLFHRAHFIDVLIDRLPFHIAHFGKRLTSYLAQTSLGPITLHFTDGTQAECDILVGCDGIKSTVRHQLLRDKAAATSQPELTRYIEPRWSGWVVYRALVPAEKLPLRNGEKHSALQRAMMVSFECSAYAAGMDIHRAIQYCGTRKVRESGFSTDGALKRD